MIDWEKPIETVDGVAAELRWPEKLTNKSIVVEVVIDGDNEISRSYNRNGTHYAGASPRLRNVVETGPTTAPMEFGPEVRVDGVKPEWLDPNVTPVLDVQVNRISTDADEFPDNWCWTHIKAIKLPANHPHYNLTTHTYTVRPEDEAALLASDPLSTPTPDERAGIEVGPQGTWHPCSSEASTPDERAVAPELVSRMVEHLKDCGQAHNIRPRDPDAQRRYDEMKAILAALEPVDADLAVAREICAEQSIATEHYDDQLSKDLANAFRRGSYDEGREMRIAINSLVRGRQLEKEGR